MKFNKIIIAVSMLIVGAMAQESFNLSSINGTWYIAGMATSMLFKYDIISQLYNMSVSCPQIYISGNNTNTVYIQPSFEFGWYNMTSKASESANITLSGLMTLENGSSPTDANFTALFSIPSSSSSSKGRTTNHLEMLNTVWKSGNSSNPLPHGPDFRGNINFKLSNQTNGNYSTILCSASNFSFVTNKPSNGSNHFFVPRAINEQTVGQVLLVNSSDALNTLNDTAFQNIITTYGSEIGNFTRLNNTCNATAH
ncbi:uncharacterized protein BX663DRAFT_557945 [Cokeromyces recurvatus]|uniref:uncharacterized protein n=1 Tax=Cokeromyces recurvatus TaxID=90255 RepID=UPI0022202BBE|nr:uncharacterized protein BX663DRAFT_557945 [Cokeromyces recurvatus]KAI7907400.1 hypothetical protein BX663DRAFT_557945 [Cokeromyces recurvatus]